LQECKVEIFLLSLLNLNGVISKWIYKIHKIIINTILKEYIIKPQNNG